MIISIEVFDTRVDDIAIVHWTRLFTYRVLHKRLVRRDTVISCIFTVTYISCHTGDCYHMYKYPRYTDTMTRHTISSYSCAPLHGMSSVHIIIISVTWMFGTQFCHVYTSLFHLTLVYHVHDSLWYKFTGIHALLVYIFLSYKSPCILHVLLLHVSSCILVIWLFPVTDIDIPVTGHESWWYAICGIPHLLFPFPVILFPVILFPFPVILFYAITRAQVQLTCYRIMYCICSCYLVYLTYQIIKITWGWGRLDGWLGHIGWMYWIHIVCPTAGDGVVLATICYSWAPVIVLAHWDSRYMLQP